MSAQVIDFPNPAAPDAEEVRSLLARIRPRMEKPWPIEDEFIGALRVIRHLQRAGMRDQDMPEMKTVIAELRREREAEEWLPADVIEFPREFMEEPLRTLRATWRYWTAREAHWRAVTAGTARPEYVTRTMANAYGDGLRKPGKRQAEWMHAEIEAAVRFVDAARATPRDEFLATFCRVSQLNGPPSRGLQLVAQAVERRRP